MNFNIKKAVIDSDNVDKCLKHLSKDEMVKLRKVLR